MNSSDSFNYESSYEFVLQETWAIPIWLWIVFGACAITFSLGVYWYERGKATKWQRGALATIRCSLLVLVLWMLGGWNLLKFQAEKPELAIVVDTSASMATRDSQDPQTDEQVSRAESVVRLFKGISQREVDRLLSDYRVTWYTLDESLKAGSSLFGAASESFAADGMQSKLGEGLKSLIQRQSGRGTAAILFLSDGINTSGADLVDAERIARAAAIPIHAVGIGSQAALPDLKLADLLIDREVYFGDRVNADVMIVASEIRESSVRVRMIDEANDRILDEKPVTFDQLNQQLVRLSFVPNRPGEIPLRFEVDSVPGEIDVSNNKVSNSIVVQDKTLRVLLVQDQPSYEFRFLKHLMERSRQVGDRQVASFELMSVLQESDADYVEQDESALRLVPSSEEQLSAVDVFILGRFAPDLISSRSQQIITQAVTEQGAGCLFVRGAGAAARELRGWPIATLLPFKDAEFVSGSSDTGYQWKLTRFGESAVPMQFSSTESQSLAIWDRLPKFEAIAEIGELKLGVQVLAEAQGADQSKPLLVTQFAGAGRVAFQATDETYRWTSFEGSDTYHQRYWGQLLRWLSRGKLNQALQQSSLKVEPQQAKYGQSVRFQVELGSQIAASALPASVKIAITGPAQEKTLTLSRTPQSSRLFKGSDDTFSPGSYNASLVQPFVETAVSQDFTVSAPPGEQAKLQMNREGLLSLAKSSRGKFYDLDSANRLFSELPAGKSTRLGSLPPVPLWNQWWIAFLFVVLIATEWLLRRQARML